MLDNWVYIQYMASMTISKTYPVGHSGTRLLNNEYARCGFGRYRQNVRLDQAAADQFSLDGAELGQCALPGWEPLSVWVRESQGSAQWQLNYFPSTFVGCIPVLSGLLKFSSWHQQ